MIGNRWRKCGRSQRESGQALVFMVLALALVLLGAGAISVDMSNLWFHRQAAQNAADSACTAGAMDLLVDAQGLQTGHQGFTAGTAFNCSVGSTAAPCQYAAKNGYTSNNATPGNLVSVSFPTTVAGVPSAVIPPSGLAANSFIRVDVTDKVQTFFSGMLDGTRTQTVRSFAVCGLVLAQSPTPLLVLDPTGQSITLSGTPNINIVGGPQRSIQVNSSAATAFSGASKFDLSLGGPNGTGSDFGVYGGPGTNPGVKLGTTGHYFSPSAPIADPFAQIPAPGIPTSGPFGKDGNAVASGVHGCPDSKGCQEYTPGYYPGTIEVKNNTAIFKPGIYYVLGGFSMDANSCAYPSNDVGDGSGGTMFYFADTNSFSVAANSGKKCPDFPSITGLGSIPFGAKCTAASTFPSNVPATLDGTVLLGPCRAPTVSALCTPNCAINYGDPAGTGGPNGQQRGILLFQNRSKAATMDFSGGGQFLLSGAIYIHQCVTSGADTGLNCSAASAYNSSMGFGGNSGSGTIVGQIVVDQINMHGTPGITMDLNPTTSFSIIKATLLR
jgi:Putative Flp pilus-assembly TadE/G-like